MNHNIDGILYKIGLISAILAVSVMIVLHVFHINIGIFSYPCLFHYITGYYCPGCGGTRAVKELVHGNLPASIKYHPLVVYGLLIYTWYMLSNTVERCTKGKISIGMKYKDIYLWIGVAILLLHWILINVLPIF